MKFVVGGEAVIYHKDLGEKTGEAAAADTSYNPSEAWTVALAPEPANAPVSPGSANNAEK